MATYGVDFRASLGFLTDDAPNAFAPYSGFNPNYPQVLTNGLTCGWLSATGGIDARDRSTTNDHRLGGLAFSQDTTKQVIFRFDLSGTNTTWDIRAAIGDQASGPGYGYFEILDDTTSLFVAVNGVGAYNADEFYDATGVKRTSSNDWVTNNATKRLTFSSSKANFKIHTGIGSPSITRLAHISMTQILGTDVTVSVGLISATYSLPQDQINTGITLTPGPISAIYSLPLVTVDNGGSKTVSAGSISSSYTLPTPSISTTIFQQTMSSVIIRF